MIRSLRRALRRRGGWGVEGSLEETGLRGLFLLSLLWLLMLERFLLVAILEQLWVQECIVGIWYWDVLVASRMGQRPCHVWLFVRRICFSISI